MVKEIKKFMRLRLKYSSLMLSIKKIIAHTSTPTSPYRDHCLRWMWTLLLMVCVCVCIFFSILYVSTVRSHFLNKFEFLHVFFLDIYADLRIYFSGELQRIVGKYSSSNPIPAPWTLFPFDISSLFTCMPSLLLHFFNALHLSRFIYWSSES